VGITGWSYCGRTWSGAATSCCRFDEKERPTRARSGLGRFVAVAVVSQVDFMRN